MESVEEAIDRLGPALDSGEPALSGAAVAAISVDPVLASQFVANFNAILAVVPALAPAAAVLAAIVVILETLFLILIGLVIGVLLYLLVKWAVDQLEEESVAVDFNPTNTFADGIFRQLPKDDDDRPKPFDVPRPPKIDISTSNDECPLTRDEYYDSITSKPNSIPGEAGVYQSRVAGDLEYLIVGLTSAAGIGIFADGLEIPSDRALEAKFVMTVDDTLWNLQKPAVLHREVYFEFFKYGEILRDPCVPVETLQVRVADEVAVEFFVDALSRFAVPGEVVVVR